MLSRTVNHRKLDREALTKTIEDRQSKVTKIILGVVYYWRYNDVKTLAKPLEFDKGSTERAKIG